MRALSHLEQSLHTEAIAEVRSARPSPGDPVQEASREIRHGPPPLVPIGVDGGVGCTDLAPCCLLARRLSQGESTHVRTGRVLQEEAPFLPVELQPMS